MSLSDLKQKSIQKLAKMAGEYKIEGASAMRRQALIFAILNIVDAMEFLRDKISRIDNNSEFVESMSA